MASRTLNQGALGEIPDDIAGELKRMEAFLKAKALTPDGRVRYSRLQNAQEYAAFQQMTRTLRVFPLQELGGRDEQLAFWINLYNALAVHGVLALGIKKSLQDERNFFGRVAYDVGGSRFSLDDIEHGILRGNRWKHPLLPRPFSQRDPRRKLRSKNANLEFTSRFPVGHGRVRQFASTRPRR